MRLILKEGGAWNRMYLNTSYWKNIALMLKITGVMSKDQCAFEVERRRWRQQNMSREQSSTSTTNTGRNCLLSENGVHDNAILEHSCGGMTIRCEFCLSLNFSDEKPSDGKFTRCCKKGKVCPNDIHFPDYPAYLKRLMTNEDSDSKNFMENIHSINSSFALASMGANIASPSGYGPYCFRIHGQVYHRTGILHPSDGVSRKFAQLYILDTAEATSKRLAVPENQGCSERLMININNLMHDIHELTKSYKMLHEVEMEAQSEAAAKGQISFDDFQESRVTQWQKALGSRMPQVPLGKVILYTSVMTSGGCALVYYLTQKAVSRASYYQLALEQLHSHPEALEALGTPLNTHYLQLMDKYNFVDIADAKLKIPVSGSKSAGHLYVISSREAPFKRWHLQEVFLELKDGQQIPVFKLRQENGDEVKVE